MTDIGTDIAAYLAAAGYGTVGTSIFVDELQDLPANQIAVFGSGGPDPIQSVDGHTILSYFDVHVRNTSKATARASAIAIRDLLGSKKGIGGHQAILLHMPIMTYFGKDPTGRHRYAVFFSAFD